jgi:TPR repeat protein
MARDHARGFEWIRRSADKGFTDAQFVLGTKLSKAGEFSAAVQWLTRAAEAGHPVAQNNLGLL